ncbi:MAG: cupin domain-containing protein [Gammaproteobacteria bacterium]|jgi:quercetin dioxygenase-like cupin family protein
MRLTTATLLLFVLFAAASARAQDIKVTSIDARPSYVGSEEHFTGTAIIDPLFSTTAHTRATGARVTFEPGARTAWHSHPAGQTLIVESGVGWVQEWGGKKRKIRAGDVIWTPPGVKHWHGATADQRMTHLAIQEAVDGNVVNWMEKVTQEEYESGLDSKEEKHEPEH